MSLLISISIIESDRFLSKMICLLQIFRSFTWLVSISILDGRGVPSLKNRTLVGPSSSLELEKETSHSEASTYTTTSKKNNLLLTLLTNLVLLLWRGKKDCRVHCIPI